MRFHPAHASREISICGRRCRFRCAASTTSSRRTAPPTPTTAPSSCRWRLFSFDGNRSINRHSYSSKKRGRKQAQQNVFRCQETVDATGVCACARARALARVRVRMELVYRPDGGVGMVRSVHNLATRNITRNLLCNDRLHPGLNFCMRAEPTVSVFSPLDAPRKVCFPACKDCVRLVAMTSPILTRLSMTMAMTSS